MPVLAYPEAVESGRPKQVIWVGDSLERLREFPREVQREIGHAIYLAQTGGKHARSKALHGFGTGILEVVSDYFGDSYRAVYTVRLATRIFVLHVFQKKSRKGIATPHHHLDLVKQRMKRAEEIHSLLEGKDAH